MPLVDKDALNAETRVRRALGLTTNSPRLAQQRPEAARQRHRFVQEGEVPVVVVGGDGKSDPFSKMGSRVAELEAALVAERAARASATRSLDEARATIQSLQTRLAHAEMAFNEAIATERRACAEAERTLQETIEEGRRTGNQRGMPVEQPSEPPARKVAGRKTRAAKPASRAAAPPKQREPQPVKWWLPSYRARKHKD